MGGSSSIEAFGRRVPEYLRGRPEYPEALLADLPAASVIVDLGAGTGKLTRLLARTGARIVAVEPQAAMAAHIPAAPNIEVVAATAEQLPLPAACADLVCCGSSFHWFDCARASAEILRIAKPGAHLALIWNRRDNRVPWVGDLTRLLESYAGETRSYASGHWRAILSDPRFAFLGRREHPFAQRMPVEGIVDRVLSTSYIAALPEDRLETVRRQVRDLIARHPELASAKEIDLPYICRLYLLRCGGPA